MVGSTNNIISDVPKEGLWALLSLSLLTALHYIVTVVIPLIKGLVAVLLRTAFFYTEITEYRSLLFKYDMRSLISFLLKDTKLWTRVQCYSVRSMYITYWKNVY